MPTPAHLLHHFATPLTRRLALLLALAASNPLYAQEPPAGTVQRIQTRDNVSVPIYTLWRDGAIATVVLFSGGGGGYGQIGEDGWPGSSNFLIRTGKRWASHPFNIVMIGRPSDAIDLSLGAIRIGEKHTADTMAILREIKTRHPQPIWLVGTSMGTISATSASIQDQENLVAGLVLSASIVAYKTPGSLFQQSLEKILVPTLVVHHELDACSACRPDEAGKLASALSHAPIRKTLMLRGGSGASGNPCGPLHHHGFIGMENETVDLIAAWIIKPTE